MLGRFLLTAFAICFFLVNHSFGQSASEILPADTLVFIEAKNLHDSIVAFDKTEKELSMFRNWAAADEKTRETVFGLTTLADIANRVSPETTAADVLNERFACPAFIALLSRNESLVPVFGFHQQELQFDWMEEFEKQSSAVGEVKVLEHSNKKIKYCEARNFYFLKLGDWCIGCYSKEVAEQLADTASIDSPESRGSTLAQHRLFKRCRNVLRNESDLSYYAVGDASRQISKLNFPNLQHGSDDGQFPLAVAVGIDTYGDEAKVDFQVVKIAPLPLTRYFEYLDKAGEVDCALELPVPKSTGMMSKIKWNPGDTVSWFGLLSIGVNQSLVSERHLSDGDLYRMKGNNTSSNHSWIAIASQVTEKEGLDVDKELETAVDLPWNVPGEGSRWRDFEFGEWFVQGWAMTRKYRSMAKEFNEAFQQPEQKAKWIPYYWIKNQQQRVRTERGFDPIIVESSRWDLPKFTKLFGLGPNYFSRVHDPVEALSDNFKAKHVQELFGIETPFDWELLWLDAGIHISIGAFSPRFATQDGQGNGSVTLIHSRKRGTGLLKIDGTVR